MVELKPYKGDYYLWKYLPSIPLAGAFAGVFLILTTLLCYRMFKARYFSAIPFLIGGIFQVIGYAMRILCHYNTNQIGPYIMQSVFILLAPVLYAASIYMVLGRLIRSIRGESLSPIRPRRLTRLFVLGDIVALTVQGNAAGLTAKDSTQKAGEAIITAGLFIQIVIFGLFCFVAFVFHRRMNTEKGQVIVKDAAHVPWRQGLWMLYTVSALIMFRSVFRVVEYIMGVDGYLLVNEWPAYALDGAPMIIVQVIFLVWFPAAFKVPPPVSEEAGYAMMDRESGDAMLEGAASGAVREEKKKASVFSWLPGVRR